MNGRGYRVREGFRPRKGDVVAELRALVSHRQHAYMNVLFDDACKPETKRRRWDALCEARESLKQALRARQAR